MISACQKLNGLEQEDSDRKKWILSLMSVKKKKKMASKDIADHSRIIVRNLKFNLTEAFIKKRFGKHGPIKSVNILVFPGKDGLPLQKGCCFIQYYHPNDAARAIMCENGSTFCGRVIIVDWAIPKEKYKKATVHPSSLTCEIKDLQPHNHPSSLSNDLTDLTFTNFTEENPPVSTSPCIEKEKKPKNSLDPDKTLFITHLPCDTTETRLCEFFQSQFGLVDYCVLVRDRQFKLPTGSAFVKFLSSQSSVDALSASKINGLEFDGVKIRIFPALSREEVAAVKEARNHFKDISVDGSSSSEIRRRRSHVVELASKLKDPNHFVSNTRLCIRNLTPSLDERTLRDFLASKTNSSLSKFKVRIARNRFRKEAFSDRKVGKIRNRSLCYGFITCSNKKLAAQFIKLLDNLPLKDILQDSNAQGNIIAEYSIENKEKIKPH